MMRPVSTAAAALAASLCLASHVVADDRTDDLWQLDAGTEQADEHGTLNPDEMTLSKALKNAERGDVDMTTCALGYAMTKSGNHVDARTIFRNCAAAGYTRAMSWMSYLDDNGFGIAGEDAEAASAWDRKAAEMGDPIAQFNYGLDLLRGRGVQADPAEGRRWVDRAASAGESSAIELQDAGYDYRSVTPDADEWKYDKRVF